MTEIHENWKKYKRDNKDVKEFFCGACLAIPLAFAGIGAGAYGASSRGSYKKKKKVLLYSVIASIIFFLLAAGVFIYFFWIKKCVDCGYKD
jgi:cation transporter-like permease